MFCLLRFASLPKTSGRRAQSSSYCERATYFAHISWLASHATARRGAAAPYVRSPAAWWFRCVPRAVLHSTARQGPYSALGFHHTRLFATTPKLTYRNGAVGFSTKVILAP